MSSSRATIFVIFIFFTSAFTLPLPQPSGGAIKRQPRAPIQSRPDFETQFRGAWAIDNPDAGVSAMQMQLLPHNKMIIFDLTNSGRSNIALPNGICRSIPPDSPNKKDKTDCWAHAVEYDVNTAAVRPLKILTDSWCSSGGVTVDGTLVSTGGYKDGAKSIRTISPCDTCDWQENPTGLGSLRWYASQEKLEDGSFILVGGRDQFTYEFLKGTLENEIRQVDLPFLLQTKDSVEDNLYPFVYLLPDSTLFIFANTRSIILDPKSNKIVRELPVLPGGARNYPGSAMSALLPLRFSSPIAKSPDSVEVLICGGNTRESFLSAQDLKPPVFLPAFQDCGRIKLTEPNPKWEIEMMPSRRIMGDMLILPNGELLLLNGATSGASGWHFADGPNLIPVVYTPNKAPGQRFKEMVPTNIPRMYHSSSAVLPDGKILVGGSNTNPNYDFRPETKFKTELRMEKFSPHYLDPAMESHRPKITEELSQRNLTYGQLFLLAITIADKRVKTADLKVTLYSPPFTTHGYSQNQRLIVLTPLKWTLKVLKVIAPVSASIAPPGYYLLHVVHRGIPSRGMWIQITNDKTYKATGIFKIQPRAQNGSMVSPIPVAPSPPNNGNTPTDPSNAIPPDSFGSHYP